LAVSRAEAGPDKMELPSRAVEAAELLQLCERKGCVPDASVTDALYEVALATWATDGQIDGSAVAGLRVMAPERLKTLPPELQRSSEESPAWLNALLTVLKDVPDSQELRFDPVAVSIIQFVGSSKQTQDAYTCYYAVDITKWGDVRKTRVAGCVPHIAKQASTSLKRTPFTPRTRDGKRVNVTQFGRVTIRQSNNLKPPSDRKVELKPHEIEHLKSNLTSTGPFDGICRATLQINHLGRFAGGTVNDPDFCAVGPRHSSYTLGESPKQATTCHASMMIGVSETFQRKAKCENGGRSMAMIAMKRWIWTAPAGPGTIWQITFEFLPSPHETPASQPGELKSI